MPTICQDTCQHARNHVCDDGSQLVRRGPPARGFHLQHDPAMTIRCAWGTDCSDCGPQEIRPLRTATLHALVPGGRDVEANSTSNLTGVDLLIAMGYELRAAWTLTQPPFIMAYTDPAKDFGVSRGMHTGRAIEPDFNLYWHRLADSCCAAGGLVVDVGSNFGYYALLTAMLGCRVVAWEPVAAFRAFLEIGAQLNNVSHKIHVRSAIATDKASSGRVMAIAAPKTGIFGTASVATDWAASGSNVDRGLTKEVFMNWAKGETVDDVLMGPHLSHGGSGSSGAGRERACILKVDVEGHEPQVIAGASLLLRKAPPRAIMAEYTPGVAERARKWELLPEYQKILFAIHGAGYRTWNLGGLSLRDEHSNLPCVLNSWTLKDCDWRQQSLIPLREVGKAALHAEGRNVANMLHVIKQKSFHVPWDVRVAAPKRERDA